MKPPDDENARPVVEFELDPAEFPALEDFFLGYLHQDFEVEYGDPESAMDAFVGDAGAEECALVAREWETLAARLEQVDEVRRLDLIERLGAAWQPESWGEVERVFARLQGALES